MKARLTCLCRGLGKAYFGFAINSQVDISGISAEVRTDLGNQLPVGIYRLNSKDMLILAVPLLGSGGVHISIKLRLDSGMVKSLYSGKLNWIAIKWLSRYCYKFKRKLAFALRDIDQQVYSHQIHVKPELALESPAGDLIIKGVVCGPYSCRNSDIFLLDESGSRSDSGNLSVGRCNDVVTFSQRRSEISFTLRIPMDGNTYTLVADGNCSNEQPGFLCFDAASVQYYLSTLSPLFYKASSAGAYASSHSKRIDYLSMLDFSECKLISGPLFSIVVPLYKTPVSFLNDMVDSVINQAYSNWELILINSTPECVELAAALDKLTDKRIKVVTLESNKGISGNTNFGIAKAKGDYVVFFDHDDTLDPFALYRYAERIQDCPDTDALYCDEDFLNETGEYVAPHFKSDFNLDLLRVHNYITHLLCVRASFAKELMLRKEFDGAQDYDFLLRLVERTQNIYHVPEVLYHWRISDTSTAKSAGNKNYADDAGRRALQEHLDRCGLNGTAELTDSACFYHIAYALNEEPLVSIVIPNKDSVEVLRRCIDSIEEKTDYRNFEILVVENNSTEDATFEYYRTVSEQYENVRIATWDGPFNYSAINNYGVGLTSGKYLLFLNNDTEVIESGWLSSMLSFCQRDDVGAVGAKLLYPDETVQHAGVMMICCRNEGEMGGPIHVFNNLDRDDPGYMRRAVISQDLSAVTAACMMTKRSVFEELNGFNEDFEVAFNDVDFCLRVRSLDKLVVFDADALLYHYESFSRGYETGEKKVRFMREQGKLRTAWAEYYVNGDPYHSPMSTR